MRILSPLGPSYGEVGFLTIMCALSYCANRHGDLIVAQSDLVVIFEGVLDIPRRLRWLSSCCARCWGKALGKAEKIGRCERSSLTDKIGNVPHGLAAHPGWPPTFAKPPPKPSHSDAKQLTLALYRTIQPKISFRVDFYCLLTRTRVMPSLTAPSTPPLGWFTCFSAHPPL
jgi:hypothetical protein